MKNLKRSHIVLIAVSVLILLGCIGMTLFLLFSNYQTVRLYKQAQKNFLLGDPDSLQLAEAQLLQIISKDDDNEGAYRMLAEIAGKQKIYPRQVYYCYMAHHLNPLSAENKESYIRSLCLARYFDRLENFLSRQGKLPDNLNQILFYAAGKNGNIKKYKLQLERRDNDNRIGELAFLLYEHKHLSTETKLSALERYYSNTDAFLRQEILAAKAELYFSKGDIGQTGKALEEAYKLNPIAFAPILGRFYANFRSFGEALKIFEKYLAEIHDPLIAMQTAEIYCLLNQPEKIAKLRSAFQADSGNIGMLCCYYFDALTALAKNDIAALKELTIPLRKSIHTPLAYFMFLCTDIRENDIAAIRSSYVSLLAERDYLDLQKRADEMLSGYLKQAVTKRKGKTEDLLPLAVRLYERKPELFTAKFILLEQKRNSRIDFALLKNVMKRFPADQGIIKIAIEYFMNQDLQECERLIAYYRKSFTDRKKDMLGYEIALALRKKDNEKVSELFRKNYSPEILDAYWTFASSGVRVKDLQFLSRDEQYGPFCKALLLLKKGDKKSACDLLEKADAGKNYALLFFSAKTLAENGRSQAALEKYASFPENSPYKLAVLMNMAELSAEKGDFIKALALSRKAYNTAPDLPETQHCYADKLYKIGNLALIPDVVKLSESPYLAKMRKLWICGMQARLKRYDITTQKEKIREMCRQILVIDPGNNTALDLIKKLEKRQQ